MCIVLVRQTPKPQLRSRLTVHALLNFRMKAEMYGTVAAVVLVGRLWFDPALRATSLRKMKVATASHSAVHSVAAWGATHGQSSNSCRLPYHGRSGVWTPASSPVCDAYHGHPFLCAASCGRSSHHSSRRAGRGHPSAVPLKLFGSLPFACSSCELAAVNN